MKTQRRDSFVRLVLKAVQQVFRVSPRHFILEYAFTFLDASLLVLTIVWLQRFFDGIAGISSGSVPFSSVMMLFSVFALLMILNEAADGFRNFYGEFYSNRSKQQMTDRLNRKVSKLSAAAFEDPEVLDQINQAYIGAYDVRDLVHVIMDILFLYIPYFAFMGIYLYRVQPLLPLILPLTFIPVLGSHLLRSGYYTRLDDQTVTLRRKEDHYKECLTSRTYFKETRVLGASRYFLSLYTRTFKRIQKLRYKTEIKSLRVETASNVFSLAGYTGILILLVLLLVKGRITIGTFAAILAATFEIFGRMEEVFECRLSELSRSAGQIRKYFRFFHLPEQTFGTTHTSSKSDIELSHVSFTYPGTSKPAVSDVSLRLRRGETIAIVGENGSGKTTLSKLLLGLYAPDRGRVLIGGVPLPEISKEKLYKNSSCVFQDFQRYQLTLRDNVRISDFSAQQGQDGRMVRDALKVAGFHINQVQMVNGLDTLISKEFAGTDLSRGEWQRLSIARAYFRDYQLIVLDEPTAAIDPFEEDRIYQDFIKLKKDRSAIIITHRLGAIRMADRVCVMREGEIAGQGTHNALLAKMPYYEHLWNASGKYMR